MSAPAGPAQCDPQAAADFLRALAHPARLRILCRLLDGEAAVSAFETELGLKQPNLSQQLGSLREAGLVTARREAKSIFYSLADPKVRGLLAALDAAFRMPVPRPGDAPRPAAEQRPAVIAAAAAPMPAPNPAQAARPGAECGVFSAAGWHLGPAATIKRGG